MINVGLVQYNQIRIAADLELVILDAENLCCARCDHVVQQLHVVKREHVQQMACKERDLLHVALAEGIVGVLNVVLPKGNGDARRQQILDSGGQGAGVRVGDDADAGLLEQGGQLAEVVLRIQFHGAAVLRGYAALPAHGDGLLAEHLQCALFRVADVVQQHGDGLVVFLCISAHGIHMILLVFPRELDPRNTAHNVRAQIQRLSDQFLGARLASDAVLREGNDLQRDAVFVLLAHLEQRLDAFKPRLGVHVGESANMGVAVLNGQVAGLADVGDNPGLVIGGLEIRCLLDAGHGAAHALAGVGLERVLASHLQGVDLVEMEMSVHKGFGDKTALCVDDLLCVRRKILLDGGDFAVLNGDAHQFGAFASLCVFDQNVVGHVVPPLL